MAARPPLAYFPSALNNPPPPRIAYLFSRYPVVSQTFCDTEMLELERLGCELTVASLNPPNTSFRHERLQRLKAEVLYPPPGAVLDLPLRPAGDDPDWKAMADLARRHASHYGPAYKPEVRARNAWHFAREFRRRGIRHIHVHFANRATHTALFLKRVGFTFSFTAHAQDFMIDLGSDDLLREMAQEAEFVVAVSDFSRDLLRETCQDSADRIIRIYNGLDPAAFHPATSGESAALRILSIGRLIEFKGFQDLIEAVAALRQRSVPAQLDIVGEGPWRAELERRIASLGLAENVRLLGVRSQDQIRQLLENCQVFALASILDSKGACDILPTVILEAMAAGLPVVSTRLAGIPEMVEDRVTGLLAPPGDIPALADALASLTHSSLRQQLGAAGRRKMETTFSLAQTAGQLAQKFRSLAVFGDAASQPAPPERPVPSVLCLLDSWPAREARLADELQFLANQPQALVLAGGAAAEAEKSTVFPQENVRFLPDAMVLEASWRQRQDLAAKAEALYEKCGPVDGEYFFREARRAVHTVLIAQKTGIRHFHALRSTSLLCAWLAKKLGGFTASFALEHKPALSRSAVEKMLPDFDFGSVSDARVAEKTGGRFPDELMLGEPPPAAGIFRRKPAAPTADISAVWSGWLQRTVS